MGYVKAVDHDELLIEEGQASLDAYEQSVVPLEAESPEEVTLDAARAGINLLRYLIEEVERGKSPTVTLEEIGEALIGKPGIVERYSKVHPNWYEKVCLAKRQDSLLRAAARSFRSALESDTPDLILQEAYDELVGEGYGLEG